MTYVWNRNRNFHRILQEGKTVVAAVVIMVGGVTLPFLKRYGKKYEYL